MFSTVVVKELQSSVCALMFDIPMNQEITTKVSSDLMPRITVVKVLQNPPSVLLCPLSPWSRNSLIRRDNEQRSGVRLTGCDNEQKAGYTPDGMDSEQGRYTPDGLGY